MTGFAFSQVDVFTDAGAARQRTGRRSRRRRARRRAHAGVRALDEPQRDHLPARAHGARRRLPRAHLHARRRAAVRRPSDARQLPRLAGAGGAPRRAGEVVQQCGVGLVRIRLGDGRRCLRRAGTAPSRRRAGDCSRASSPRSACRERRAGEPSLDNGPTWVGLLLDSAATVLALEPDHAALRTLAKVGVIGPQTGGADSDVRGARLRGRWASPRIRSPAASTPAWRNG